MHTNSNNRKRSCLQGEKSKYLQGLFKYLQGWMRKSSSECHQLKGWQTSLSWCPNQHPHQSRGTHHKWFRQNSSWIRQNKHCKNTGRPVSKQHMYIMSCSLSPFPLSETEICSDCGWGWYLPLMTRLGVGASEEILEKG